MVGSGIFTTTGEPIEITGNFTRNSFEITPLLDSSDASLYIAVNSSSILFGTLVNVQKQSRSHAVIYLQENPKVIPDLHREIIDFFSRCNDSMKRHNYSILPVKENTLLRTIVEDSACRVQPFYPPEDIMHYTYGRLCVGKNITCFSRDPLRAIDYLVHFIEKMPPNLMTDVVLAITKLGFGQADIIVTDNRYVQYQINLDEGEGTIRSTAYPEYYKKLFELYDNLSSNDIFMALKDQILLQFDNKCALNPENKGDYHTFLANEKITTSVLSLNEVTSDTKVKKEPKIRLMPRVFRKDKSDADAENDLNVMIGDKTLLCDFDYKYNPENKTILINDKSEAGRSWGEACSGYPSQQQYGDSSRNDPSVPLKNYPKISSNSQQTWNPTQNIVKKPAPSQSGGNLMTNSLPKNLAIFGVGDTGFHHLSSLARRQEIYSQYTENGCHLELYSLLDETGSQKQPESKELDEFIQSLSSNCTYKNCISYTVNPKPAKLISAFAETTVFIVSLSDLKAFDNKIPHFIENIRPKGNLLRKIFLFLIQTSDKNNDKYDLPSWTENFIDIISIKSSADLSSVECDDVFFDTFVRYMNTHPPQINVLEERGCTSEMSARYSKDIQMYMQDIQMWNTWLKDIEPLILRLPCNEIQHNSQHFIQTYKKCLIWYIEILQENHAIQKNNLDTLKPQIACSSTLDNLQMIVKEMLTAENPANMNNYGEFKKELQTLLTAVADYGKKIDSITNSDLRTSLQNVIFKSLIEDEELTRLKEGLSAYLNSEQNR